ncbi:hypothetical protein ES705_21138 [subsurface metagenome]
MTKKYWKVRKGVYSGITPQGKKFMGKMSAEAARKKAGSSRSRSAGSKTSTSRKSTRRRGKLTKKRRRGSRKFTIPIAPVIGLAAGLAGPIKDLMDGEVEFAVNKLKYSYLGLDTENKFKPDALMSGLVPLVVGGLVHKFVGGPPLNLNRMLTAANVPVIRI